MAAPENPPMQQPQTGSVPVPDPTKVTTEAIDRLEKALKELFGVQFRDLDSRISRQQSQIDDRPSSDLIAEKFKGVADNFSGRDTALAAALQASALSAAKSEAATTKLIDGISDTITSMAKNFDDKIEAIKALIAAGNKSSDDKVDDVRARVGAVENQKKGATDNLGAISLIVSIGVGLVVVIGFVVTLQKAPAPIVIERVAPAAANGLSP